MFFFSFVKINLEDVNYLLISQFLISFFIEIILELNYLQILIVDIFIKFFFDL